MKGCPSRRRVSTTPNWVALRSQPWGRTVPPPLGEERSGLLRMSCRWAPLVEARRRALLLGRPDSPRLGEKTRAGGMCSGLRRNRLVGAAARGGVAGGVGEGAQAIAGEGRYSGPESAAGSHYCRRGGTKPVGDGDRVKPRPLGHRPVGQRSPGFSL